MKSQEEIKKITSKLPDTPGVYFFRHGNGAILYIGKATSLRDRVRSYFSPNLITMRGKLLVKMVSEFNDVDFQPTDSVLEALILEANLIKKYQPPYNTKEKDNKSFNYVVITKEDFPRVMLARGRDLEVSTQVEENKKELNTHQVRVHKQRADWQIKYKFGPFPQGSAITEGLVLIRKIFPFRDTKCIPAGDQKLKVGQSPRACFNYQIGLCPGVCVEKVSKTEYRDKVNDIVDFFRGNKKKLVKNLETRMVEFARLREFEKAGEIKRQIFALNHIHDISLIKQENIHEKDGLVFRVEAYDVAHFGGKDVVGVMTVVENGTAQKSEYRKFKIKENPGINDTKALREILERRFAHQEWRFPSLVVVDGGVAQKNAAESVLEKLQLKIPVMAVVKNEHHKPKAILGERHLLAHESVILLANAESHRYGIAYHKKTRRYPL